MLGHQWCPTSMDTEGSSKFINPFGVLPIWSAVARHSFGGDDSAYRTTLLSITTRFDGEALDLL